jgi:lysozyme
MSPLGIALIQFFEEYVDKAYRHFPHEPWTCGWGHTKGVTETTTCTPDEALAWLQEDIREAEAMVNRGASKLITQHQFDALVSLAYNIGVGNFERANALEDSIAAKQWAQAARIFEDFDHINGKPDKGLLRRRKLESALFLDGVST